MPASLLAAARVDTIINLYLAYIWCTLAGAGYVDVVYIASYIYISIDRYIINNYNTIYINPCRDI